MDTASLRKLQSEYNEKRNNAIFEANQRKLEIYKKYPDLEKIDNDISTYSIKTIQSILTEPDKSKVNDLKKTLNDLKAKKTELLKKHNITRKDFEPQYECSKCNDTGFIKKENETEFCSCIKQRLYNIQYNASNIYDLKNQNFKNFKLSYYSTKSDPEKYNQELSPRDNMKKIFEICNRFIENFDSPTQNNLLFCGSPGLGKTFHSSCIANELIQKDKTVLYQTASQMLEAIINTKFGKYDSDFINTINTVDLLIIDDLGTETPNKMKIDELFTIINQRLLNQDNHITKTIISTNLLMQNLYEIYEERICSRLIGNYDICLFYGDDIRIKKKVGV